MILFAFCLGGIALAASAMFSGSETGFYRVPRIRLKIDAADGDRTARFFLWLVHNPSLFVATLLVGNNIANNTISMATVLLVQGLLPNQQGIAVELASTLLLAPFLFVYGEMFPKYIALNAPYTLLRRLAPLLFLFFLLFLPLTWLLWLINTLINRLTGRRRLEATAPWILARNELGRALDEGRDAGVLEQSQRRLADSVFAAASINVGEVCASLGNYPMLQHSDSADRALDLARQHRLAELPVFEGETPIGYVRTIDLEWTVRQPPTEKGYSKPLPLRDFVEIDRHYSPLTAMSLFLSTPESLGCVVEADRNVCIGLLHRDTLRDLLFTPTPEYRSA